jgi:hypothetical protein
LAEKVLAKLIGAKSTEEASSEYQHAKTALATDLIWLAKAGHVIEFADGTLDLPLPPRPVESEKGAVHPSAQLNLEIEKPDSSPDEESETALLEADEEVHSEREPAQEADKAQAPEIAEEETIAHAESPSAESELSLGSSLELPANPPELVEAEPVASSQ